MNASLARTTPSRRSRGRRALAIAAVLGVIFAIQGCAVEWSREQRLYCAMDDKLQVRDTLYFGRSIPGGGEVGDADWKRFESDVLGHAFPQGFTVLDAHGTWRGTNGESIEEPTRVVVIVHDDDPASRAAIDHVAQDYRTAFHQESVLRERTAVCVAP